jgi:serine/threonine protein kinase
LLSEHLEATSLKQVQGINATDKLKFVFGIGAAIRKLHQAGICHSNLKPENVLIDSEKNVHLTGYGLSQLEAAGVIATRHFGTAAYLPPEHLDAQLTQAGDVYSFGILLYEIVTGTPVFDPRASAMVLIKKVISGVRAEIPATVTDFTRSVIERCWQTQAEERPTFEALWKELIEKYPLLFPDVDLEVARDYLAKLT